MNANYVRGRSFEYKTKKILEKDNWLVFRSSGSHTFADLIAIKEAYNCSNPSHFEVKFVQVKCSQKIKKEGISYTSCDTPIGGVNVEFWRYPARKRKFIRRLGKAKSKRNCPKTSVMVSGATKRKK